MVQITQEGLSHQPDHDDRDDAVVISTDGGDWRSRLSQYNSGWHGWRGRITAWGGLAAIGLTGGFIHAKVFEGDGAVAAQGQDRGVATAPAIPGVQSPNAGNQANPNTSPTPSSGGFNTAAGGAALTCTQVRIVPLGGSKYNVIPVVSGDTSASGLDLYTIAVNDNDTRVHKKGIAWLPLDSAVNTSFPLIEVVDLAGTGASPADLDGPLGGSFPDSHVYDCPVTAYPAG